MQQRAQEAILLGPDARAKHDQQVDIRVQAQGSTAVAANRAEDNGDARRPDRGCGTNDDSIHAIRERAMSGATPSSGRDLRHERMPGCIQFTRNGVAGPAMFVRRNA